MPDTAQLDKPEQKPAFAETTLDLALKERLTTACHILYVEGQNDFNHGQVSARRGRSDQFWVRGAAMGFDEVTTDSFALCDMTGAKHAGSVVVPPEWPIHTSVYRRRPDVNAIIHTHAPNALIFGARNRPLVPISHDGCPFYGRVSHYDMTTNTITTEDMAEALADSLGDGCAVLLKNHGLVVAGANIKEATIHALCLEQACALQLRAEAAGEFGVSPEQDIYDKRDFIFSPAAQSTYWSYYERKVARIKAGTQLPQTRW